MKGVDLGRGEKRDELLVEPFGRDGQDSLDHLGVLGVTQRGEGEQRADGGQPQVAGARAVVPVVFEVVEERRDQVGIEVGPIQAGRGLAGAVLGEPEQQLERVAVGRDGARADLPLLGEPVGEERLQCWGDGAHRVLACLAVSRRRAARANSSGAADRYQYVQRGSRCPR